jgi:uncharacterized protein (TIGR02117 family)
VSYVRRALRVLVLFIAGALAAFVLAALLTVRPGDRRLFPAPDGGAVTVHVVSHGYHSGLVVSRETLAAAAERGRHGTLLNVARRFGAYDAVEIGWGDEQFYRHVPTVASLTWKLALKALFQPGNASVLHVVGLQQSARETFPASDIVALDLSPEGFSRLVVVLDATFARDARGLPETLGQGLYGPSLFYRAVGEFNLLNVCNHWTARLLDAAGVPTAPVLATLPYGMLLDLRFRSGVTVMPAPAGG